MAGTPRPGIRVWKVKFCIGPGIPQCLGSWDLLRSCPRAEASGGTHTPLSLPSQCKEEAVSTLDAVQALAGVSQLLPKSRENYLHRCMDQERLRRESTSQKEMDKVSPRLHVSSWHQPTQVVQGLCCGAMGLPDGE